MIILKTEAQIDGKTLTIKYFKNPIDVQRITYSLETIHALVQFDEKGVLRSFYRHSLKDEELKAFQNWILDVEESSIQSSITFVDLLLGILMRYVFTLQLANTR